METLSSFTVGGISIPDFKSYYSTMVIKAAWYYNKNRQVYQWARMDDPEINLHTYRPLIFHEELKTIKWIKENIFNKWY